jgi:hypothetical protein
VEFTKSSSNSNPQYAVTDGDDGSASRSYRFTSENRALASLYATTETVWTRGKGRSYQELNSDRLVHSYSTKWLCRSLQTDFTITNLE